MRLSLLLLFLLLCSQSLAMPPGVQSWDSGRHADAVAVWQPLAEQGDAQSMLFLAFAYRTGRGVERDDVAAYHWYREAALRGMPEAQFQLGLMAELGQGAPADAEEAAYWYGLATEGDFCPSELPAGGMLGER